MTNLWRFSFTGQEDRSDWGQDVLRVSPAMEYRNDRGYGFLGISVSSAAVDKVVDGYWQTQDTLTKLTQTARGVKAQSGEYPIRFALRVEPNTYYRVKVTVAADGGEGDLTLTSERRHFLLTHRRIPQDTSFTWEFTSAVHNVKWKNRDGDAVVPLVYEDRLWNLGVMGSHIALSSVEICQIPKPRTLFLFGDSTVCDTYTALPYNGFDTCAGWGQAMAKYLSPDTAVINLAEGGLSTWDQSYFDLGKDDIGAGDLLVLQLGHNERSAETYLKNLDYYVEAARSADAKFVLCSPIHRLTAGQTELPWPSTSVDTVYAPAAAEYAAASGLSYIDLNALTVQRDTELGTTRAWHYHSISWAKEEKQPESGQASGTFVPGEILSKDPTHMNDYGADNTCRLVVQELKALAPSFFQETSLEALPEALQPPIDPFSSK